MENETKVGTPGRPCYNHLYLGKGRATLLCFPGDFSELTLREIRGQKTELVVSASFCSPKDRFSRRVGREKAMEHFLKSKFVFTIEFKGFFRWEQVEDKFRQLCHENKLPGLPSWALGPTHYYGRW